MDLTHTPTRVKILKNCAMLKTLLLILSMFMLTFSCASLAQEKASDFFRNLSKEKNILSALYNKNRKSKKDTKPFTLSGEAGLLSTTGNTDTSIIKIAFEANHELKNWSNRYEAQFLERRNKIQRNGESLTDETSRIEISAQLDYKLVKPNNRLFAYLEYDDNQFNRLRDQATVVLGWSQVAWKDDTSDFRYSVGPGYSHLRQERSGRTIEEMIVRGTLQYNLKFGKETRFRQVFSAEMGEEISKARSQSSITAKIFEKLAMKLSVNLVFNDSVAQQDSQLSTQTSISMVYHFF
jgi:putative salt-induced outer membrane protein YdiY